MLVQSIREYLCRSVAFRFFRAQDKNGNRDQLVGLPRSKAQKRRGLWAEWHCRFVGKWLCHAAASSSSLSRCRGFFIRASIFGRRLLTRGSTRPSRWPTRSLADACWPCSVSSSVALITAQSSQFVASSCCVVVKLRERGSRPDATPLCNIFRRTRVGATDLL
jgi:hypothetical protein